MEIMNVRVDDRLVHSQVAYVWSKHLNLTRIMVVDDGASQDDEMSFALRMSTPKGIRLSVLSVSDAAKAIEENDFANDKVMIICKGSKTITRFLNAVGCIKEITLGNLRSRDPEAVDYAENVRLLPEQVEAFHKLMDNGITITVQMIPSSESYNLNTLI